MLKNFKISKVRRFKRSKLSCKSCSKFGKHMKSTFDKSFISSISDIAEAPSCKRKLWKFLMFAVCMTGMVYQVNEYAKDFFSYMTVVSDVTENPKYFDLPAITLCNKNSIKRKEGCGKLRLKCLQIEKEEMCNKTPTFCPDNDEPYPGMKNYKETFSLKVLKNSWEDAKLLSHSCSVTSCYTQMKNKNSTCRQPYLDTPTVDDKSVPVMCCTLFSAWEKPEAALKMIRKELSVHLTLKTEPEKYSDGHDLPSIFISVHDPKKIVSAYRVGYKLFGGSQYVGKVTRIIEEEKLLAPYDTNCRNYTKEWLENNGTGPTDEETCRDKCRVEIYRNELCVTEPILYPHDLPMCNNAFGESLYDSLDNDCSHNCRTECNSKKYEVEYERIGDFPCENSRGTKPSPWCAVTNISLKLAFRTIRLAKRMYIPQIPDIEFFSKIGGFLGMWVGICSVDFIFFLESLWSILIYPCTRKRRVIINLSGS